jgi:hypothetical protein
LTADEVAAMEKGENPLGLENGKTPNSKSDNSAGSGTKRKADSNNDETPAKKNKVSSESAEEDEEEGEEDLG